MFGRWAPMLITPTLGGFLPFGRREIPISPVRVRDQAPSELKRFGIRRESLSRDVTLSGDTSGDFQKLLNFRKVIRI